MAQGNQLYHGHIQLADTDSQRYESLEFSTPQHPSEKSERLILRLLAYTLLYEPVYMNRAWHFAKVD